MLPDNDRAPPHHNWKASALQNYTSPCQRRRETGSAAAEKRAFPYFCIRLRVGR
jgi:hypothetical protein